MPQVAQVLYSKPSTLRAVEHLRTLVAPFALEKRKKSGKPTKNAKQAARVVKKLEYFIAWVNEQESNSLDLLARDVVALWLKRVEESASGAAKVSGEKNDIGAAARLPQMQSAASSRGVKIEEIKEPS